jgi:signal transduction histidine kinase
MAHRQEVVPMGQDMLDMERKVARCRILLSAFALSAAYLGPDNADLLRSYGGSGAPLGVAHWGLLILGAHLGYSLAVCGSLLVRLVPRGIVAITTWVDVVTGAAIAIFTDGPVGLFHVFFAFAVVAAGVRGGFRFSMIVTAVSIWLYVGLSVVEFSRDRVPDVTMYVLRPAYLAVTGYLVAYLGRLRLTLEGKLSAFERARERGDIARALHDGCVQALAGTNLSLGSCRELVRRGRVDDALTTLHELQTSITREYDALRTYIRELADREVAAPATRQFETEFRVKADFAGPGVLVEHVLQILLEGARNVRRHAFARSASLAATAVGSDLRIRIDDDGLGFSVGSRPPWSIASRVDQLGGEIVVDERQSGAHLDIAVRAA